MRKAVSIMSLGSLLLIAAPAQAADQGWLTYSAAMTVNGTFPVQAGGAVILEKQPKGKAKVWSPDDKRTGLVSVSPSGKSISFTRLSGDDPTIPQQRTVYVRTRLKSGKIVTHSVPDISPSGRAQYSADGKYAYVGDTNGINLFHRVNVRTGKVAQVCDGCRNAPEVDKMGTTETATVVVSPDGKYIAALTYAGYEPGQFDSGHAFVQIWKLGKKKPVASARTQPTMSPSDYGTFSVQLTWTPDSKKVAFARFVATKPRTPIGQQQIATLSVKGVTKRTGLRIKADGSGNTNIQNPLYFKGRWYAFTVNYEKDKTRMISAPNLRKKADQSVLVGGALATSLNLSKAKPPKVPALPGE